MITAYRWIQLGSAGGGGAKHTTWFSFGTSSWLVQKY